VKLLQQRLRQHNNEVSSNDAPIRLLQEELKELKKELVNREKLNRSLDV
jgi:hypothetical protein